MKDTAPTNGWRKVASGIPSRTIALNEAIRRAQRDGGGLVRVKNADGTTEDYLVTV